MYADNIDKEVEILIRLSLEIENSYSMDCLINDMSEEHLYDIIKALVSDNNMNWGRIVILFVLAAKIAQHHVNNKERMENIICLLNSSPSQWIKTSGGGWNTFILQFDNTKKGLLKSLFNCMLYYCCKIVNGLIVL